MTQGSQKKLLTVIDEESDRLNRLIEQAVEMSQLDAHKVQLDLKPQSVAALIYVAVEQCRSEHPRATSASRSPASCPTCLSTRPGIEKVLANLLGNAAKYSPPDQPIFVAADPQKDMLAISVADRGAGIDPMEQSLIFDKFYRGQGQRSRVSGTGMGLAICRAMSRCMAAPSALPARSATAPSSPSPSPSPPGTSPLLKPKWCHSSQMEKIDRCAAASQARPAGQHAQGRSRARRSHLTAKNSIIGICTISN